jgi:hypothetical protein
MPWKGRVFLESVPGCDPLRQLFVLDSTNVPIDPGRCELAHWLVCCRDLLF